ncbi:MAG: 23S rRNA pseudouridine(955/2504/2580) synthase RluC [Pseudomonadota bacterium]
MPPQTQPVRFVEISENNHQQRIDNFLIQQLRGVPKGKVYKILRKGEVRVNKKRIKPEYKLQAGDIVRIPPIHIAESIESSRPSDKLKQLISNSILYEDDRLIVLNKPSGIAVHGGSGIRSGVIEVLRASRPESDYLELVHRIDRDTSGCLMIAKRRSALRALHEQLRNNQMKKVYHAIVKGHWDKNTRQCTAPLHKNQLAGGERIVTVDETLGKQSKTQFRLIGTSQHFSVIQAQPITGRTHQIRVHCTHLGHPIANDPKYGDESYDKVIKGMGCKRLCLHAYSIEFTHPVTEKRTLITATHDDQMQKLMDSCQ